MDCGTKRWLTAEVAGEAPPACEDAAWAYDAQGAKLYLFGGWNDKWISSLYALDVSAVVGPPYAVHALEPSTGPVS